MEEESSKEYRWESGYEKTWEAIQEDKDGMLDVSVQDIIQKARRKRLAERTGKTKLGMMRHLYLVVDTSQGMEQQDLKPTRLLCCMKVLEGFIDEYFYLNPISQLGIITTGHKKAEKVSEMTGNPRKHLEVVKGLSSRQCGGEPSLGNCLELVMSSLRHMPSHASREMLLILGSLTTCDPGDISKTIAQAKELRIRCSVVHLAAEVRIYRELSRETGGQHSVALDDLHLRDLLSQQLDPPVSTAKQENSLIRMGFPSHAGSQGNSSSSSGLGMCLCHIDAPVSTEASISNSGYLCPQCSAKYCELPVECRGCGLTLVSAPHLARSYHHLFPLPPFLEVEPEIVCEGSSCCTGCSHPFPTTDRLWYKCPTCNKYFCTECDLFIHETLHTCPGCAESAAPSSNSSNSITPSPAPNINSRDTNSSMSMSRDSSSYNSLPLKQPPAQQHILQHNGNNGLAVGGMQGGFSINHISNGR